MAKGKPKTGHFITCVCGKKRWVYPYEIKKGLGKFCSQSCANKANGYKLSEPRKGKNNVRFGKDPWNKGKQYSIPERQGENSHAWRGGKTKEHYRIRRSSKAKIWRDEVFKRDNYKCRVTGENGILVPHHIKLFSYFPEDRFDINNGITLLETVHKALHKMSHTNKPFCDKCSEQDKKVQMIPIVVSLSLTTYRCPECSFEKTVDKK